MIAKTFLFLNRYLLKHPIYVITYAFGYMSPLFAFAIRFYSEEEIRARVREGKSIIRLGDGEINLLLDIKNHYHSFSPVLKKTIKHIIQEYKNESNYILAIPKALSVSNKELKLMQRFNIWMPFKVFFFLCFPKHLKYMDAHAFYRDGYFERVIAPVFTTQTIIIITNSTTIQKLKSNQRIPWKDIVYIETPETDSLFSQHKIKETITAVLSEREQKSVVLFFALGPVGKGLIKEYAEKGYQGIDIGRGIETMFTNESIESLI